MVVVGQESGFIRDNWLYSGKAVVFGQSGCNPAKRLCLGKVVVIGQRFL